uniref:Uncharacterized protein n=1 Tax=Loxodonta africana TaxID=9785 RepID=G3T877_LOXAF
KEDLSGKKSTKRSSQQPLPYAAPLSPKFPKTKALASKEEWLTPEEIGKPKEEKLPEESKNSSLNSAHCLNPICRNLINIRTSNSRNFIQPLPGTSSSALVGNNFFAKISHHEVNRMQMQRKNEGI